MKPGFIFMNLDSEKLEIKQETMYCQEDNECSGEILDKLKARDFNATSLSTYKFSTLYTTLPHNFIKDKLIYLIERIFNREGSPYLACNDRNTFFTSENPKNIMHAWSCQNVCDAPFCWTTFLFDLAPSCIDK